MTIDLKQFVSKNKEIIALHEPYVHDGYEYATDGYICIRIKTDKPNTVLKYAQFPRAWELFEDFSGDFYPLSVGPKTKERTCGCAGGYVPKGECPDCAGTGVHECDCGTSHDCGYCFGTGMIPSDDICPQCKGKKVYMVPEDKVFLPNRSISGDNLEMIMMLPNLEYNDILVKSKNGVTDYMQFRFDGGEGIIGTKIYGGVI